MDGRVRGNIGWPGLTSCQDCGGDLEHEWAENCRQVEIPDLLVLVTELLI